MMKITSLLVMLCFTFNVLAGAGTVQELERQFDDYQYAMTVEWDQKDSKFQEAETMKFFDGVSNLMSKGLSTQEVMSMAEKKMGDKKALEALKLKLTLAAKASSPEELSQILKVNSKEFYSHGASWNGSVVLTAGLVVLIVAVIGYSIWFDATHECVAYEERYACDYYEVRTGMVVYNTVGVNVWDITKYRQQCGMRSYCTEYVKKK